MAAVTKSTLLYILIVISCTCTIFIITSTAHGQDKNPLDKVKWQLGPSRANLGIIAEIILPDGFVFADANDTRYIMELFQNPPTGRELGFVAPNNLAWFTIFQFTETGYVKDDEKASLDADAILESIRKGTSASNEERKKRGWETITILGWQQVPHYDSNTNNLEWATRAQGESSGQVVNYNTRLLGRSGVMSVTLVCDPSILNQNIQDYKMILANYKYSKGNRYEEFVQGDKVAKYGLSALIVGGAAAAAAKTGVFKWLWKVLLGVAIGVGAFAKKIFGKKA